MGRSDGPFIVASPQTYLSSYYLIFPNSLVYRDIRKENIGFDVRGDVKVFDFGLSKCLSPALKARDDRGREVYGYNLTPRTGVYSPCDIPGI